MLRLLRTRVSACVAFAYRQTGSIKKAPIKVIATVLAAALITSSMSAPASAFYGPYFKKFWWYGHHHHKKKVVPSGHSNTGAYVIGCLVGSAAGLIFASTVKGGGPHWMSQKEFETTKRDTSKDLDLETEAVPITFTCGLYAPVVAAKYMN